MTKVEAIIKPFKLDEVKEALVAIGVGGMIVTDVRGSNRQPERRTRWEGAVFTIDPVPKAKLEGVVPDRLAARVAAAICAAARTGAVGDGKVFVLPIVAAARIRTGETGEAAL